MAPDEHDDGPWIKKAPKHPARKGAGKIEKRSPKKVLKKAIKKAIKKIRNAPAKNKATKSKSYGSATEHRGPKASTKAKKLSGKKASSGGRV